MLKVQGVSNAMDHTRANIIDNLHDVTKQILRLIHISLKQNKRNHVLICLNVLIVKGIIKQIPISVFPGSIASIGNNMLQNTRKLETIEPNQSAQL